MNTHGLRIDFGKYGPKGDKEGELWTRVPVSYLKWMLTEGSFNEERKAIARSEMERRGTATPNVDVSGHAIDRASQTCRKIWHETKIENEGLYSWLCRITREALESGEKLESGKIKYLDMKFLIIQDGDWPVLQTIMPSGRRK